MRYLFALGIFQRNRLYKVIWNVLNNLKVKTKVVKTKNLCVKGRTEREPTDDFFFKCMSYCDGVVLSLKKKSFVPFYLINEKGGWCGHPAVHPTNMSLKNKILREIRASTWIGQSSLINYLNNSLFCYLLCHQLEVVSFSFFPPNLIG